jgi:prevent-host-death family protein
VLSPSPLPARRPTRRRVRLYELEAVAADSRGEAAPIPGGDERPARPEQRETHGSLRHFQSSPTLQTGHANRMSPPALPRRGTDGACASETWSRSRLLFKILDRQHGLTNRDEMTTCQLQTAKQRFSAVAENAARGIPQLVTKHGKPFVVIVSAADWCREREPEKGIWEVLRDCPADLSVLDLARNKDLPRKLAL